MANNSDGSAVYEVKVGEDDYIDGPRRDGERR